MEYIDFYMFHGINKEVFDEKILKFGLLDEMIRMKEAGKTVIWVSLSMAVTRISLTY